jgi:hypothetical protein
MLEFLWLVLTGFFFTGAASPHGWGAHPTGGRWLGKLLLNIAAVFFLNLYLGEALR